MLCVESGYEYNREIFLKVMDRELNSAKCKLNCCTKDHGFMGLNSHLPCIKIAGMFKVKIKTATPTGQLRLQKPANRASLFYFKFSLSKSLLCRGYGTLPNPKIKQKQYSQMQWSPTGHVSLFSNSTLLRVGKSIRMQGAILYNVQCVAHLLGSTSR